RHRGLDRRLRGHAGPRRSRRVPAHRPRGAPRGGPARAARRPRPTRRPRAALAPLALLRRAATLEAMMHITIDTPAGPFTIIGRDEAVLAAGFTADPADLLPQVHPSLRGESTADADLEPAVKATRAYFDGDLTAIDAVPVVQRSDGEFLG